MFDFPPVVIHKNPGRGALGKFVPCRNGRAEIWIRPGLAPDVAAATLDHELVHLRQWLASPWSYRLATSPWAVAAAASAAVAALLVHPAAVVAAFGAVILLVLRALSYELEAHRASRDVGRRFMPKAAAAVLALSIFAKLLFAGGR